MDPGSILPWALFVFKFSINLKKALPEREVWTGAQSKGDHKNGTWHELKANSNLKLEVWSLFWMLVKSYSIPKGRRKNKKEDEIAYRHQKLHLYSSFSQGRSPTLFLPTTTTSLFFNCRTSICHLFYFFNLRTNMGK